MPPRPRVAFVTYAMHCGGMETLLLRLGGYLKRHGCELEVLTTVQPGEWFGRWAELGIPAQHIAGLEPGRLLAHPLHSRRVAAKLLEGRFDVLFLHHSLHAQASIARLPESAVVIPVLHNDDDHIYQVGCSNPAAWNVAVAVSPKVADMARQRAPGRPVIQISSGVDLPDASLLQSRPSMSKALQLIFVGRLDHGQKGVMWLPDILEACKNQGIDARLSIVGDGPHREALQQRLAALHLLDHTRYFRGITPERVYDLLLEAHVLLMPSQYEGLPIALLESQACGCVPVVSHLPGTTDTAVTHGKTGLLVGAGDISGFANAVATLYRNEQDWSRMSQAGYENVRHRFSVEAMGAEYLLLIGRALSGGYPLPRLRSSQPKLNLELFSWRDLLPRPLRQLWGRGRAWLAKFSEATEDSSLLQVKPVAGSKQTISSD